MPVGVPAVKAVGVPESHIHLGNKKDNFWEMGNTGPCGPCTEVHIDRTPDKTGGPLVNGGTDKVIEIWNLVFIQFNRNEDQSLTPLPPILLNATEGKHDICFQFTRSKVDPIWVIGGVELVAR